MIFDKLTLESARRIDDNGYMHVGASRLTKEQIAPYVGSTIPGWKELGLEPARVYRIYRPGEELKKAADTFNGLPLALDHWEIDASSLPKDKIVGSLGTEAQYDAPYLTNSLTVTDADAIERVKSGEYVELSAGYLCDVDMTPGRFDGQSYDGRMYNIRGNHVALVREGRAGHDVRVADSSIGISMEKPKEVGQLDTDRWKNLLFGLLDALRGENDAAEKAQEAVGPVEKQASEEAAVVTAADEEPVDKLADELRMAMQAAGLDPEDKAAQKAFLAGRASAQTLEDNAAQAEQAVEAAADKCAKDAAPGFTRKQAAALYTAAEEVAPHIGRIANPFAFDSAASIYRKALDAKGVDVSNVHESAYGAMVRMMRAQGATTAAADMKDDPINEALRAIRTR